MPVPFAKTDYKARDRDYDCDYEYKEDVGSEEVNREDGGLSRWQVMFGGRRSVDDNNDDQGKSEKFNDDDDDDRESFKSPRENHKRRSSSSKSKPSDSTSTANVRRESASMLPPPPLSDFNSRSSSLHKHKHKHGRTHEQTHALPPSSPSQLHSSRTTTRPADTAELKSLSSSTMDLKKWILNVTEQADLRADNSYKNEREHGRDSHIHSHGQSHSHSQSHKKSNRNGSSDDVFTGVRAKTLKMSFQGSESERKEVDYFGEFVSHKNFRNVDGDGKDQTALSSASASAALAAAASASASSASSASASSPIAYNDQNTDLIKASNAHAKFLLQSHMQHENDAERIRVRALGKAGAVRYDKKERVKRREMERIVHERDKEQNYSNYSDDDDDNDDDEEDDDKNDDESDDESDGKRSENELYSNELSSNESLTPSILAEIKYNQENTFHRGANGELVRGTFGPTYSMDSGSDNYMDVNERERAIAFATRREVYDDDDDEGTNTNTNTNTNERKSLKTTHTTDDRNKGKTSTAAASLAVKSKSSTSPSSSSSPSPHKKAKARPTPISSTTITSAAAAAAKTKPRQTLVSRQSSHQTTGIGIGIGRGYTVNDTVNDTDTDTNADNAVDIDIDLKPEKVVKGGGFGYCNPRPRPPSSTSANGSNIYGSNGRSGSIRSKGVSGSGICSINSSISSSANANANANGSARNSNSTGTARNVIPNSSLPLTKAVTKTTTKATTLNLIHSHSHSSSKSSSKSSIKPPSSSSRTLAITNLILSDNRYHVLLATSFKLWQDKMRCYVNAIDERRLMLIALNNTANSYMSKRESKIKRTIFTHLHNLLNLHLATMNKLNNKLNRFNATKKWKLKCTYFERIKRFTTHMRASRIEHERELRDRHDAMMLTNAIKFNVSSLLSRMIRCWVRHVTIAKDERVIDAGRVRRRGRVDGLIGRVKVCNAAVRISNADSTSGFVDDGENENGGVSGVSDVDSAVLALLLKGDNDGTTDANANAGDNSGVGGKGESTNRRVLALKGLIDNFIASSEQEEDEEDKEKEDKVKTTAVAIAGMNGSGRTTSNTAKANTKLNTKAIHKSRSPPSPPRSASTSASASALESATATNKPTPQTTSRRAAQSARRVQIALIKSTASAQSAKDFEEKEEAELLAAHEIRLHLDTIKRRERDVKRIEVEKRRDKFDLAAMHYTLHLLSSSFSSLNTVLIDKLRVKQRKADVYHDDVMITRYFLLFKGYCESRRRLREDNLRRNMRRADEHYYDCLVGKMFTLWRARGRILHKLARKVGKLSRNYAMKRTLVTWTQNCDVERLKWYEVTLLTTLRGTRFNLRYYFVKFRDGVEVVVGGRMEEERVEKKWNDVRGWLGD